MNLEKTVFHINLTLLLLFVLLFSPGSSYDPFCAQQDIQTGQCIKCICRYYFDENRNCQQVSDLCRTWNINTGDCFTCYAGYQLVEGKCQAINGPYTPSQSTQDEVENPNCRIAYPNGTCIGCRPNYLLHCGDCQLTGHNLFCSSYNENGDCTACEGDLQLDVYGICVPAENSCAEYPNCADCSDNDCTQCEQGYQKDQNGQCRQCAQGYFKQFSTGKCAKILTTCSNFENCVSCTVNECIGCAQGYATYSWPPCQDCARFYVRDSQNDCTPLRYRQDCNSLYGYVNCQECTYQQCRSCLEGYRKEYQSQQCAKTSENCVQGCALCSQNECFVCAEGYSSQSWPPCIGCSYMYTRNSEGKCKAIQRDCSKWQHCSFCVVGECLRCETGYQLNETLECVEQN